MSNITQIAAPDDERFKQTYWQYGWEKCKKQPFVPLGALATCIALGGATVALRSGNRKQFNKYLRYRVAAQGVTVLAAVAGAFMVTNKSEQIASSRERVATNQLPPDNDPVSYASSSSSNRLARPNPQAAVNTSSLPAPSAQTSKSASSPSAPFDSNNNNPSQTDSETQSQSQSLPSALAPPPNTSDKSTVITALRKRVAEQKSNNSNNASLKNTGPTRQGGYEGDFGGKGFEARLREAERNAEDERVGA